MITKRMIVDGKEVEGAIVSYECPLDGSVIVRVLYEDPDRSGRLWAKRGPLNYTTDGTIVIGKSSVGENN